jgi:hypothetical protein
MEWATPTFTMPTLDLSTYEDCQRCGSETVAFDLPMKTFGPSVEEALAEARRRLQEGGVQLNGTTIAELRLQSLEVSFGTIGDVPDDLSRFRFEGALQSPPPFPFAFDGHARTFFAAMLAAASVVKAEPFDVEAIRESAEYWIFPTRTNGCLGAIFDRRAGKAIAMGSAFPIELWIWGYERGLLDEDYGASNLIVTEVRDRGRAVHALRRLGAGFKSADLAELPLIVRGAATWTSIPELHNAGDAILWRVEGRTGRAARGEAFGETGI